MPRIAIALSLLLFLAPPAQAQSPPPASVAEGAAAGLFMRPAVDAGDLWMINGFRLSFPMSPRLSIDLESATVFGGENGFSRVHGLAAVQLRFLKPSADDARHARYWIAGLQLLPGDELNRDGSIHRRRVYANATAGIGARQLMGGAMRLMTEASLSAGNSLMASITVGIQWGPHRTLSGR